MKPEDFLELVQSGKIQAVEVEPMRRRKTATPIKVLTEACNLYQIEHEFKVGDLVVWKANLCNRSLPSKGEPAIVLEVLNGPIYDDRQPCTSPYFGEPLDILLGVVDSEGDVAGLHSNSRLFEPYLGSLAADPSRPPS